MKTRLSTLLLLLLTTSSLLGQSTNNGAVVIIGSRFTYPFLREVISDFKQRYPSIEVQLLERGTDTEENANLIVNGHELAGTEIRTGYTNINFGSYVIVPVTNSQNPWLAEVSKTGLDKKEIKAIFFNKEYDPIYQEKKEAQTAATTDVHLFTRDQKACAPTSFAAYYGFRQENLIGRRIIGSDLSLLFAVKSDPKGLTYSVPTHLYNLETRLPLTEWTIVPIDQNGNNEVDENESIFDNLDQLLEAVANKEVSNIPLASLNISFPAQLNADNQNLALFVDFLLSDGQQKARKFGFLELPKDKAAKQRTQINTKL